MKTAGGADSAPAQKRRYVSLHLEGTQQDCTALMAGISAAFGPEAIHPYGHSFPRPKHGPDHVSVHMRVTPAKRPRRRPRFQLPRRKRSAPASMTPVRASIKPAGPA